VLVVALVAEPPALRVRRRFAPASHCALLVLGMTVRAGLARQIPPRSLPHARAIHR